MTRFECHPDTPKNDRAAVQDLINRSSLGTRGARTLQQRISDTEVELIRGGAGRNNPTDEVLRYLHSGRARDTDTAFPETAVDIAFPEAAVKIFVADECTGSSAVPAPHQAGRNDEWSRLWDELTAADCNGHAAKIMTTFIGSGKTHTFLHLSQRSSIAKWRCRNDHADAPEAATRCDLTFDQRTRTRTMLRSNALWDLLAVMAAQTPDRVRPIQILRIDPQGRPDGNTVHWWKAGWGDHDTGVDAVVLTNRACGSGRFLASAYEALAQFAESQEARDRAEPAPKSALDELREVAEQFADELEPEFSEAEPRALIVVDNADDDADLVRLDGRAFAYHRHEDWHPTTFIGV